MLLLLIVGAMLVQMFSTNPLIDSHPRPQVIRYEQNTDQMPNAYNFHYQADDGSSRSEQGAILNPGTQDAALDVQGAVRWYDNKSQLYEMTYKAGKRGYRTVIKKIS